MFCYNCLFLSVGCRYRFSYVQANRGANRNNKSAVQEAITFLGIGLREAKGMNTGPSQSKLNKQLLTLHYSTRK